jgi:2-keto-4-pentenoate hydratase/2-oxohepta-3-ene-1,7-dioic acid hydratase in catechol pathway
MQILRFESDDKKIYTGCEFDGEAAFVIKGDIFSDFSVTKDKKPVKRFLTPMEPSAILCIGLNYRLHAKETGAELPKYPVVFMKNPGAATGHLHPVQIPSCCTRGPEVDYEAELAVIIKTPTKNVPVEKALDHVLGYSCANDISARKWQKNSGGGQWVRGKSFDTFCPFGPWIVTADEISDPNALDIECVLNGKTMQKSNTGDMIFSVAQIISFLSESTTLLPGTLIMTGTPEGVGFTRKPPIFLGPGDKLETKIKGIGTLQNSVVL